MRLLFPGACVLSYAHSHTKSLNISLGLRVLHAAQCFSKCVCRRASYLSTACSRQAHPLLYETLEGIWCVPLSHNSRREELFANCSISSRGAIRRPPNSVSWFISLRKLNEHGDNDAATIVRAWNSGAPKSDHIIGSKAQAVKHLLEFLPPAASDILLRIISKHGWDLAPFHR